jgi:hypothetical protein
MSNVLKQSFTSFMYAAGMEHSSITQNRRSSRSQVLLTAVLEHAGASLSVKLRNLSSEGALVEGQKLPIEGTPVEFRRNELSTNGRVVWVNGKFAGVAFDQKLNPEQVLRHIPAPRPKIQPRYYRPGFLPQNMTAAQQRLAESWIWSPSSQRPGE